MRHAKHWEMGVHVPDVLIVPSKLAPLTAPVLGTLVINPGQLVKGTNGGTYANMTINPLSESNLRNFIHENQKEIPHDVPSRSNVTILKI